MRATSTNGHEITEPVLHPSQRSTMETHLPTLRTSFETALMQMTAEQPSDPYAFLSQFFLDLSRKDGLTITMQLSTASQSQGAAITAVAEQHGNVQHSESSTSARTEAYVRSDATLSSRQVGLKDVPEAVLFSMANTWLTDRDAASLARVDWSRLRNLRTYTLKTFLSVSNAVRVGGFDVPQEQIDRIVNEVHKKPKSKKPKTNSDGEEDDEQHEEDDQQEVEEDDDEEEEEEEEEKAAAEEEEQKELRGQEEILEESEEANHEASFDKDFTSSSSPASDSTVWNASGISSLKPLSGRISVPKVSASFAHKYTFGTPTCVFIHDRLDVASLPFLPKLLRARELVFGRYPPSLSVDTHDYDASIERLSFEYLAQYLPPSLTLLGAREIEYCTLRLSVPTAEAFASIHLPPSLTKLTMRSFALDTALSKQQSEVDMYDQESGNVSLDQFTLPQGLKILNLNVDTDYWETQLRSLRLPKELRVLRIETFSADQPPSAPLAGLVLPSQLEEIELDVDDPIVCPLSELHLPKSLLKLSIGRLETVEGLRLPPRLQSLTIAPSQNHLRIADLNSLPDSLTYLQVTGGRFQKLKVDMSGIVLPKQLQVFEVDYDPNKPMASLASVGTSLTKLNLKAAGGDEMQLLQAMQVLHLPKLSEVSQLPPNLTELHVQQPDALENIRLPETLLKLYVSGRGLQVGANPLRTIANRPPRLELINYQSVTRDEATRAEDFPLHGWTPIDTITSLTFNSWPPDLALHQVRWPAQLVHLSLGAVHQALDSKKLGPPCALRRELPKINEPVFLSHPAKKPKNWPATLTSLYLLDGYSEAMAEGYLPPNLRELRLCPYWNAPLIHTHFPSSLTSLSIGSPLDVNLAGGILRGGSAFAQPLIDLLSCLPDGLTDLRVFYDKPLPPSFTFSPHTSRAVGSQMLDALKAKVDSRLKLPTSLRQLHLQWHDRLADGWDKLILDRPQCATFFSNPIDRALLVSSAQEVRFRQKFDWTTESDYLNNSM